MKIKIKIKIIIEYYFIILLFKLLSILPLNFVSFIGGIVFRTIGPLTKTNKIAKKNYIKIFPSANKKEINKQTALSWSNMGKTFFELSVLNKIIFSRNNKINIEGKENIEKVINNKEQVIFIGIHESNWEILLPTIDKIGLPVGGIYRHINNPYINKLIIKLRNNCISSHKSFYTPKGQQSAKEVINAIKNNLSIVLLIDQKDSAGEIVSFFNYPSKTQIGFIKLARKYNLKIIPIHNVRNKKNNFTLTFYPPLENISKGLSDIEVMEKIHSIIEKWIKDLPSNWFLQHNRFN